MNRGDPEKGRGRIERRGDLPHTYTRDFGRRQQIRRKTKILPVSAGGRDSRMRLKGLRPATRAQGSTRNRASRDGVNREEADTKPAKDLGTEAKAAIRYTAKERGTQKRNKERATRSSTDQRTSAYSADNNDTRKEPTQGTDGAEKSPPRGIRRTRKFGHRGNVRPRRRKVAARTRRSRPIRRTEEKDCT